jgi:hypothetical protein
MLARLAGACAEGEEKRLALEQQILLLRAEGALLAERLHVQQQAVVLVEERARQVGQERAREREREQEGAALRERERERERDKEVAALREREREEGRRGCHALGRGAGGEREKEVAALNASVSLVVAARNSVDVSLQVNRRADAGEETP